MMNLESILNRSMLEMLDFHVFIYVECERVAQLIRGLRMPDCKQSIAEIKNQATPWPTI